MQLMLQSIAKDSVEPLLAVKAFYPEEKTYTGAKFKPNEYENCRGMAYWLLHQYVR